MKHPFLALLTLLASLTFASEVLGQTIYTSIDGEDVSANAIRITWVIDGSVADRTVDLGVTFDDIYIQVSHLSMAFADYPNGLSRRVVDANIEFTITGGELTYTDGTTILPGQEFRTLSDDPNGVSSTTGGVTFTSWALPAEPGEYQITAAVVGTDPTADPPPGSLTNVSVTMTAIVTEDPENPDRDARNSLNTDSAIQGIGGINNNIMHHLEQLRRNQRD